MLLGLSDEHRKWQPESPGDAVGDVQAGVSLTPFDEANVRVVDLRPLGQGLLRKSICFSVLSHNRAEGKREVAVGHRASKMAVDASEDH